MNGIVSGKQIKFGEDTQTGNMTIKSLTTIGQLDTVVFLFQKCAKQRTGHFLEIF